LLEIKSLMKFNNVFDSKQDQKKILEACQISSEILDRLLSEVKEGNTPFEINKLAGSLCKEKNVKPAFLGVEGVISNFPGNVCLSVNQETLHTIPLKKRKFKYGDIISVDFGIIYEGFYTDHCKTTFVGEVSADEKRLIDTTHLAVETAIKNAVVGKKVGEISNALENVSDLGGFDYVRGYAGHGIGKTLWEDPSIPYHGEPTDGPELQENMLLCVELQLSLGSGKLKLDDDGWTLSTKDGSKSAMFEQMVMVKKDKPLLLTEI